MSRQENDTIYRQDAIDAFLTELTKRERKNLLHTWSTVEVKCFITGILEQMSSAQPRWIPVTERLPEEDVMVLVTCYGRDMIIMRDDESLEDAIERVRKEVVNVTVGLVGSDGWYGADYSPMIITPVAWMPLPDPWKGDEG